MIPTPRARTEFPNVLRNRPRFTREELERIEAHERATGVEHVQVVDPADQIKNALQARGYGVNAWSEPGPRDGEVIWTATAAVWAASCRGCSQHAKVIARATGSSRAHALRALAGELGVAL